jgi:Fe-S-cluster containining protein
MIERDPIAVARLAAEREGENWRFRSFLKNSRQPTDGQLNRLAKRLGEEATAQIDCRECAACCRNNVIPVSEDEIARLASRLGEPPDVFRAKYVRNAAGPPHDAEQEIDASPCPFLQGNLCSVYEVRPQACRDYPYVGGDVRSRSAGIIERAGTCPIIFNMWERLKGELGFRRFLAKRPR